MEQLFKTYLSLDVFNPLSFRAANLREADEHFHIINSGLLHICLVNYTHGRHLCTHVFTYVACPEEESGRQRGATLQTYVCDLHMFCTVIRVRYKPRHSTRLPRGSLFMSAGLPGINPYQFLGHYRCIKSVHVPSDLTSVASDYSIER